MRFRHALFVLFALALLPGLAAAGDAPSLPTADLDPAVANGLANAEAPAAPVDPSTGLPEVVFLGGPIPGGGGGGTGGGGGGTGGGGNNYTCEAGFQCPGDPSLGIAPYYITCQGQYSCESLPCGVKCDGFGTGCIPSPMC